MTRHRRQGGFTLIELMVAATTGLILMVALGGILSDTVRTAESLTSRIAVNRHAREIFDLLAFGSYHTNPSGATIGAGGELEFDYVFGLRGRNKDESDVNKAWRFPSGFMVMDEDQITRRYRFALPRNGNPLYDPQTVLILAESIQDVSVACTGTNVPLHGCLAGTIFTGVRGFLAFDPDVLRAASTIRVGEIAFRLADTRRLGAVRSFRTDATEVYWTAFTALQQQKPY